MCQITMITMVELSVDFFVAEMLRVHIIFLLCECGEGFRAMAPSIQIALEFLILKEYDRTRGLRFFRHQRGPD